MTDATTIEVDIWAKAAAGLVALLALLRHLVQLGRLIERLDTLTREVEELRVELADARQALATLQGQLARS